MTLDPALRREFDELLDALCDESPTDAQLARLYALVESDPAARAAYVQHVLLHGVLACDRAGLPDHSATSALLDETLLSAAALHVRLTPPPAAASPLTVRLLNFVQQPLVFSLLVATIGTISLLLTTAQIRLPGAAARVPTKLHARNAPPLAAANLVSARLVHQVDCQWITPPGEELRAGQRLQLREGTAELVMSDGARVVLQGPAALELRSASEGMLHFGQLTAHVPQQAHGFRLHTPHLTVVDLGTEFGVHSEDDATTEVVVYSGAVEVLPQNSRLAPQRLVAGEALHSRGRGDKQIFVAGRADSRPLPRTAPAEPQLAGELIWGEDFETLPRRYQPDESPGIFSIMTKWGDFHRDLGQSGEVRFYWPQGKHFFYGQLLDDREVHDREHGFPDPPGHAITFGPIDVGHCDQLQLAVLLAATSTPRGPFQANDFLILEAAVDGRSFEPLAHFTGPAKGIGPLRDLLHRETPALRQTFNRFTFPLPAGESLTIRIRGQSADGSRVNEAMAIDDVQIRGARRPDPESAPPSAPGFPTTVETSFQEVQEER